MLHSTSWDCRHPLRTARYPSRCTVCIFRMRVIVVAVDVTVVAPLSLVSLAAAFFLSAFFLSLFFLLIFFASDHGLD